MSGGEVVVRWSGGEHVLNPGECVSVGREAQIAPRLPDGGADPYLSAEAVWVHALEDRWSVEVSPFGKNNVDVRDRAGRWQFSFHPGDREQPFRVGEAEVVVVTSAASHRLNVSAPGSVPRTPRGAGRTLDALASLEPRDDADRVLIAACRKRIFDPTGRALKHAEVGALLGISPDAAKQRYLRHGVFGMLGLEADDKTSLRQIVVDQLVRQGLVTAELYEQAVGEPP